MRDVFPETFDKIDYSNLESAVKKIEDRLRYSEECLDYAVRETTKAVEKGGTSSAEVVMRLYDVEGAVADIRQTVRGLQASVNRISTSDRQQEIKTGRTPPLASTVGAIGQLYIDTYSNVLYYCSSNEGTYYVWTRLT